MTPADLRTRYGLGRHDLARDPGDLYDLVRAVVTVTGRPVRAVAEAIGCSESWLHRRMRK